MPKVLLFLVLHRGSLSVGKLVGSQLKLAELDEVCQGFVEVSFRLAFQDKFHIQVVGAKQLTVLQHRWTAEGDLLVSQVTFNLFRVLIHYENT